MSNNEKVDENKVIPYTIDSEREKTNKLNETLKTKKKNIFIISSVIIVVLAIIITTTVILLRKRKRKERIDEPDTTLDLNDEISDLIKKEKRKLEGEPGYSFKTQKDQYNRIYVNQQYNETSVRNGKKTQIFFDRKTIYDIYVISERESNKDEELFFSKMYTCAISIAAECTSSSDENCEPRMILGLTGEEIPKDSKFRYLQQKDDLKDIRIPLCLFNITNHNAITSITCPNSMKESKIKGIVLDLYFFRPPGVQRIEKDKNNITIKITDLEDNKTMIRETNGGICDDESGFSSYCSTDFNATKDSEGNLLNYDEICIANITNNEQNYFIKNKITHLFDMTDKSNTKTPIMYKEKMDKLLNILNPIMKYYELVSKQQFQEIYDLTIHGELPKKKRRLTSQLNEYIEKKTIFNYTDYGGANIILNLEDDSSLNTKTMKANSYLKFNENTEQELVNNFRESKLTDLLNELIILSNAGYNMTNELYQNTKYSFKEIIEEINNKISQLKSLLKYENITKIFDTSLNLDDLEKLPSEIVEKSNILYENFTSLFKELYTPNIKEEFSVIKNNIDDFILECYKLVYNISNNLQNLGNSMNSEGSKLTEISMYYLKQESSPYMKVVEQAEEILKNYYKMEAIIINSTINSLIDEFENSFIKSSENEKNMIIELYKKMKNKTFIISNVTDDLIQKTIDNLSNSTLLIDNILDKIKYLIKNELDLKGDFYISQSDININNISFTGSIEKAKEIAEKLDKDKYIDKKFDEIMSYFRQIFSDILLSMGTEKEEQFNIEEEVLQYTLFKNNETKNIQKKFNSFSIKAINEIKDENENYKKSINTTITNFMEENKEQLNSIISDLYILFSNETLKELAILYDFGFNSSLKKISNDIKNNEILAKNYLDDMKKISQNTSYIIELLKSFQQDSSHIPSAIGSYKFKFFNDSITQKKITNAYITKYNNYKDNIKKSKNYINEKLGFDLIDDYRNPVIKLRKALQSIKNNKLNDKYPDFPDIGFKNHKKIIDILFQRLDEYFSDNIFNERYLNYSKEFISNEITNVNGIKNYIDNLNTSITNNAVVSNYDSDYCVQFTRVKSYMCSNRQWKYRDYSDNYCLPVSKYTNNYLNLKEIDINSDENIINYNNKFDSFLNLINQKIDNYTSKINILNSNLTEIEDKIMNKKNVFDYISSFKNELDLIFENNYGDKLIKSTYDYYKKITEQKIGKVLNKTTYFWINAYEELKDKLNKNKNNFNSSINEFSIMTLLYNSIITQNISKAFYNSIIIHQKNEFNYTLSYYYNYLLRLANSTHNYLINRILTNQNYLNYIVEKRINLINDLFFHLMENVTKAEKESLKIEKQLNVLEVEENNFFKVNNISQENLLYTSELLNEKLSEIKNIKNNIKSDQYSTTARFYLENLECRKQINYLYKQINDGTFITLNKENFGKIILNNNWIFNFDEFNNGLEVKLFFLEKEIDERFQTRKENYAKILEEILNCFFTKNSIIEKVNELYKEGIKKMDNNIKNQIINKLNEILNKITQHLSDEKNRLENTISSYNDNTTIINNTIKEYKKEILDKVNNTIIIVALDFYKNIQQKFYKDYIINCLNKFYDDLKDPSIHKEFKLLNSSFDFNNIINNIIIELQNEYKTITEKQIIHSHNLKIIEIYNSINLNEIKIIIDNKIDSKYNDLINIITKKSINDAGYNEYKFNNEIKEDINKTINEKINNMENIINSTKGENYNITIIKNWKQTNEFDFTQIDGVDIKVDIINVKIKVDFQKFYEFNKEYERTSINNVLEELIKTNFNNLLNYLIPSFGKIFFERIIKYNENFKIITLYDNLRYSVTETLSYYISISKSNLFSALPVDLKIKLYNLNDLALIIENYNEIILNKINDKIDDFIYYIQNYILEQYSKQYNEFSVEKRFNDNITSLIKPKLQQVNSILIKACKNNLEYYFKEPFVKSYKKLLNEKTNEMLRFANNQKEILRQQIFNKFTINSEEILNNINENINKTEKSIKDYKDHNETFKINKEFIQKLNNYGQNKMHPLFSNLITTLNNAKTNNKNIALNNLDKESKKYENFFNLNEFINTTDNITCFFRDNYINNITENIDYYDADNYNQKLKIKMMEDKNRYLRHLQDNETNEDMEDNYYGKIPNKALHYIFNEILNSSHILKIFIDGGNEFDNLDIKFNDFFKNFKDDYNKSLTIIEEKKTKGIFDDELYNTFLYKLNELKNMTQDYYTQIYQSYNNIRDYLKTSIYNIDDSLIKCSNVTYNAFTEEYIKIKNKFISFEENNMNNSISNKIFNLHYDTEITGDIEYDININSYKNSIFSLDIEFEGAEGNNPTVIAKIINLSGPKDMNIDIFSGTTDCREKKKTLK